MNLNLHLANMLLPCATLCSGFWGSCRIFCQWIGYHCHLRFGKDIQTLRIVGQDPWWSLKLMLMVEGDQKGTLTGNLLELKGIDMLVWVLWCQLQVHGKWHVTWCHPSWLAFGGGWCCYLAIITLVDNVCCVWVYAWPLHFLTKYLFCFSESLVLFVCSL